ncbi:integrase [Actinomadura graeca]|uniref:Integrase n=1 Tax=Actinomadura graeca TaxID=2750812 RepID=A0ABX8R4Y5_9ACTN|nr:integrase [Actinomadura graeca]QXJ24068.1 integrase [Actinomadura graeca]
MRVQIASEPGRPDKENEDFAAAAPGLLALVAGTEAPADTGCEHSVAWYARHLGGLLLAAAADTSVGLGEALAVAIERVNALHAWTCDLSHPDSPSAAVALARVTGDRLEHLLLSDATLVLDRTDQAPEIVTDDRRAELANRIDEPPGSLASYRNQPDGFWVASTKPEAASEAFTGSTPLTKLDGVALLSNDSRNSLTWPELLAALRKGGPAELIARIRETEASTDASALWWTTSD